MTAQYNEEFVPNKIFYSHSSVHGSRIISSMVVEYSVEWIPVADSDTF